METQKGSLDYLLFVFAREYSKLYEKKGVYLGVNDDVLCYILLPCVFLVCSSGKNKQRKMFLPGRLKKEAVAITCNCNARNVGRPAFCCS